MKHKALIKLTSNAINELLVFVGSQCHHGKSLRLPTREESRAVRARQNSNLYFNGTDIRVRTTIDASACRHGDVARDIFLELRDRLLGV